MDRDILLSISPEPATTSSETNSVQAFMFHLFNLHWGIAQSV
jgi:hypothetical protein